MVKHSYHRSVFAMAANSIWKSGTSTTAHCACMGYLDIASLPGHEDLASLLPIELEFIPPGMTGEC
jgi:hypothetical protein